MTALPAPSGATHRNARESLAAPGAPHRPTTRPGETPAPTCNEPLGGRETAQLASLEGCGFEGAGAAAAGYVTSNDTAEKA